MAINPGTRYPGKIAAPGASYPYGSAQNVTVPGDGTGTPWEQAIVNDMFGIFQKLLNAAGVVPSGNADTVLASDYFDSLEKLFSRYTVFTDTGAADVVQLAAASGANPAAYVDGQEIEFFLNNTLTGAATIEIAALGAETFAHNGGVAFAGGELLAGQNVRARYDLANTRFDLVSEMSKVGKVEAWPLDTAPAWGLICDGTAVSRSTYVDLFSLIGTTYGIGDGATTFNLPDYRGEFLRGKDGGAGNDPDAATRTDRGDATVGDNVGTKQTDAMQGHIHDVGVSRIASPNDGLSSSAQAGGVPGTDFNINTQVTSQVTDGINGVPRITSETRGTNTYVNYAIRVYN